MESGSRDRQSKQRAQQTTVMTRDNSALLNNRKVSDMTTDNEASSIER